MRLRLVDLDGNGSTRVAATELGYAVQRLDFADMGPRLRLWATRRAFAAFAQRLAEAAPPPGNGPVLTLLGSGDFHHLAAASLARVDERFTVIHFDNHPDWARFAPAYHCGSWVNRALALPCVERVVTIGPCSGDLDWPELKGGNLAALKSGRIELYPWRHEPSAVVRRMGARGGYAQRGPRLVWRNVGSEDWPAFLDQLRSRLPTDAIWITVDKDVLRPADAATNWDQGDMPLDALIEGIKRLAHGKRVLGADLCGDYSPPDFGANAIKKLESWQDHSPAPDEAGLRRNVDVNRALLAAFNEALG